MSRKLPASLVVVFLLHATAHAQVEPSVKLKCDNSVALYPEEEVIDAGREWKHDCVYAAQLDAIRVLESQYECDASDCEKEDMTCEQDVDIFDLDLWVQTTNCTQEIFSHCPFRIAWKCDCSYIFIGPQEVSCTECDE